MPDYPILPSKQYTENEQEVGTDKLYTDNI